MGANTVPYRPHNRNNQHFYSKLTASQTNSCRDVFMTSERTRMSSVFVSGAAVDWRQCSGRLLFADWPDGIFSGTSFFLLEVTTVTTTESLTCDEMHVFDTRSTTSLADFTASAETSDVTFGYAQPHKRGLGDYYPMTLRIKIVNANTIINKLRIFGRKLIPSKFKANRFLSKVQNYGEGYIKNMAAR